MLISKKIFIGGIGAVIVGTGGILPAVYFGQHNNVSGSAAPEMTTVTLPAKTITGKPVRVQVPSLGIDLTVNEGAYNSKTQQWTLSTTKAYFANLSVQPNDAQGNTLVYGHALPAVFARLTKLQPGAEARLITDNGYVFTYTYRSSVAVKPTDTTVFNAEGAPRLTLQTCTGSWSQNRELFSFDLVKVEKAS